MSDSDPMCNMLDLLKEHVSYIAMYLPEDKYPEAEDVEEWISDPIFEASELGIETDVVVDLAFSYGYLKGVADVVNLTIGMTLDKLGISVATAVEEARAKS